MTLRRYAKHFRAEIQADGFRAVFGERESDVARAAAEVERGVAGLDLRQRDDAAFPKPVQAEALEVVQKIVASRDAGKKVVDLRGTLFAGGVKFVAHRRSLAVCGDRGKARENSLRRAAALLMSVS